MIRCCPRGHDVEFLKPDLPQAEMARLRLSPQNRVIRFYWLTWIRIRWTVRKLFYFNWWSEY